MSLSQEFECGATDYCCESYLSAVTHFANGHKANHVGATLGLARCFLRGYGAGLNTFLGRSLLRIAEKGGVAPLLERNCENSSAAAFYYAFLLEEGFCGVSKDCKRANDLYEECARKGNHTAMRNIGYNYQIGRGFGKDMKKAMVWFEKAHRNGSNTAAINIGYMFFEGLGVRKDSKRAHFWYLHAAQSGDALAMLNVADNFLHARGNPGDMNLALLWYERAMNAGEVKAYKEIGYVFDNSYDDQCVALHWYERAFCAGDLAASLDIADAYVIYNTMMGQNYAAAAYYYVCALDVPDCRTYAQNKLRTPQIAPFAEAAKRRRRAELEGMLENMDATLNCVLTTLKPKKQHKVVWPIDEGKLQNKCHTM